jgi:ADP-ribose pyrophosphatase YjhB (NUDIX family)
MSKKTISIVIVLLFICVWSAPCQMQMSASGVSQQPGENTAVDVPAGEEGVQIDALKKGISIMEKIFDHVMSKEFDGDYETSGFFSSGCQGYWVPNAGLLFKMNVTFPLRELVEPEKDGSKAPKGDLWEKFSSELEGTDSKPQGPFGWTFGSGGNAYDADKIRRLKVVVVDILSQYGQRLDGFSPQEMISVLVESEGSGPFPAVMNGMPSAMIPAVPPRVPTPVILHKHYDQDEEALIDQHHSVPAPAFFQKHYGESASDAAEEEVREETTVIQQEVDIQAEKAAKVAEQVEKHLTEVLTMAKQYIPEDSEWSQFIPSAEELKKNIPTAEQIKKFIPKEKDLQKIQETVKMLGPVFHSGGPKEKVRMVLQARFGDIKRLDGEALAKKITVTVY